MDILLGGRMRIIKQKNFSVITAISVMGCMSMSVNWNKPNDRDGDEN